jgi:hypothetical protein
MVRDMEPTNNGRILAAELVGTLVLMLDDSHFEETAFAGLPGSAELRDVLNEISDVVDVSDD